MKRCGFLFLALCAAGGCVELDVWVKDKAPPEPAPAVAAPPRPRALVSPGDVTERNAREVLDALREELDRGESDAAPSSAARGQAPKRK